MKLKDIKAPDGYQIKGFDYPCMGDYILLPSGEAFKVDSQEYDEYHCPGIILEKFWEPERGKYYEFSDSKEFTSKTNIRRYAGRACEGSESPYVDGHGDAWLYIRPVQGELGQ